MLPIILSIASLNFSVSSMNMIIYMIIYLLVMFFIIKPILNYLVANKYKALNNEFFALFLLVFLFSSLVSEKIGLHAIFGGFVAGLISLDSIRSPRSWISRFQILFIRFWSLFIS